LHYTEGEDNIVTSYGRFDGDVWVLDGVDPHLLGSNEVRVDLGSVLTPSNPGSCGVPKN